MRVAPEGVDGRELLHGFADRTDRILQLVEGFVPEAYWLDDEETLTYLHACVSTKRHRVRVPETPMYLDALLADQPLTGGLEPRLGAHHLRTLTIIGFPTATFPGILDELNRLAFPYRWSTRAIMLDKTEATRLLTKIRRQWFAKRKSIAAILKEVMTNEASTLLDTDAANKAADADLALQELGSDEIGEAYVTATRDGLGRRSAHRRRKVPAGREGHPGPRFHLHCRDGECDRGLARLLARPRLRQCPAAAGLDPKPRPYDARSRRSGPGRSATIISMRRLVLCPDGGLDALPFLAPCRRRRPHA